MSYDVKVWSQTYIDSHEFHIKIINPESCILQLKRYACFTFPVNYSFNFFLPLKIIFLSQNNCLKFLRSSNYNRIVKSTKITSRVLWFYMRLLAKQCFSTRVQQVNGYGILHYIEQYGFEKGCKLVKYLLIRMRITLSPFLC